MHLCSSNKWISLFWSVWTLWCFHQLLWRWRGGWQASVWDVVAPNTLFLFLHLLVFQVEWSPRTKRTAAGRSVRFMHYLKMCINRREIYYIYIYKNKAFHHCDVWWRLRLWATLHSQSVSQSVLGNSNRSDHIPAARRPLTLQQRLGVLWSR